MPIIRRNPLQPHAALRPADGSGGKRHVVAAQLGIGKRVIHDDLILLPRKTDVGQHVNTLHTLGQPVERLEYYRIHSQILLLHLEQLPRLVCRPLVLANEVGQDAESAPHEVLEAVEEDADAAVARLVNNGVPGHIVTIFSCGTRRGRTGPPACGL